MKPSISGFRPASAPVLRTPFSRSFPRRATPGTVFLSLATALLFGAGVLLSSLGAHPVHAQSNPSAYLHAPRPWGQNPNGMHIYIWAGLKSHFSGQHDYPQFLADWSKILTEHGAVVDGALHPPSAADLKNTDVVVIYKGDAAYLSPQEKTILEAYIKRGGGLVSIHDSLCGPDPAYFSTLVGGAKKHGQINFTLGAPITYSIADPNDPIMKGMSNITIWDEAFFKMTWSRNPKIHVLATAVIPATPSAGTHKGEVVPQIWSYVHTLPGGKPARAFVWMQGHIYANFSNYQIQQMLLRGIAWAGKQPVDSLVDYVPPKRPMHGFPGFHPPTTP